MRNNDTNNLARAKRLITVRKSGDAAKIQQEENAVALDIVGPDVLARDAYARLMAYPQSGYMTDFAATEAFAKELHRAIAWYTSNLGAKSPRSGKYDPLFATPVMFKDTWSTRQVVDELGIPYWFYAQHAVMYWAEQGNKRIPRPTQLCAPDVVAHVMGLWADPQHRYQYPLFGVDWDARFGADQYTGEPQQNAHVRLIDQRLADSIALGIDMAVALAPLLGHAISRDFAVRRYGQELVDRAVLVQAASEAETFALVSSIRPADTVNAVKHV